MPAHLPREEMRLDIQQQACPCCGGELRRIGETVSEMLDHVPGRLRVIVSAGRDMAAEPAVPFTRPLPLSVPSPGA
jgi:transposase